MADEKILAGDALKSALGTHEGWLLRDGALEKAFELKTFRAALDFVNAVGALAEKQDHHPDIDVRFSKVLLRLSTHDAGGITARDVRLAMSVDAIPLR